jgi:hypothetical protein
MRRFAAALAAVGAIGLMLGGCSIFRTKDNRTCPVAGVLSDLDTVHEYRPGPGRDLTDLQFTAALGDVKGTCKYTAKGVDAEMTVVILGERGPALDRDTVEVEYFVAVTGPDNRVLNKEVFRTTLSFAGGRNRTGSGEELVETIPLPKGADGSLYRTEVGFQLTPEQVEINRRRRAGGSGK